MEVMRTAYEKSWIQSQHVSWPNSTRDRQSRKTREYCESKRIVYEQHFKYRESFGGKGPFEMRHSFLYFVGMHFRIFVRKFLVHLRTAYASPQKLARYRWVWYAGTLPTVDQISL